MDDSFQPGATPVNPDAEVARARTGGAWSQLSAFEATRKENEQRARFKGDVCLTASNYVPNTYMKSSIEGVHYCVILETSLFGLEPQCRCLNLP